MQVFNWRITEANRYIKDFIYQDETNSMWTGADDEEAADTNLLDTPEHATGTGAYETVDNSLDVESFRAGFETWLSTKFRDETVVQYIALFDIIYSYLKEGYVPKRSELQEDWSAGIGAEKSLGWFKALFANLPKLIDLYVTNELGDEEVNPFIEVMQNISKSRPKTEETMQPISASVFGGLKLAEEFPINHEVESTPPPSGSNDSGSGGGMNVSMGDMGDLGGAAGEAGEAAAGAGEAVGAAAGAGEAVGALAAPLALLASKAAAQWEVPKCKGCGSSKAPTDCLACHEKFCGDCMLNHHANNPAHSN
jgi:hypothetical protein